MSYADDVNMLWGSVYSVKKNAEALLLSSEEIGLEVNADKTKYMVMSWDQNAGRITVWILTKVPLKGWKSSNIWEQTEKMKILFREKLRAEWI